MKRLIISLAFAFFAVLSFAQDFPAGMRMEMTSVGEDDFQQSLFSYKDDDGTFAYYLSLGRVYRLLEISSEIGGDFSLDHIDEICICMGKNYDEVSASLEALLNMFEMETGTVVEFPCRLSMGLEKLGPESIATCIVTKRFLQAKRLCFHFVSGHRSAETDLKKSALKSLRWSFNLYKGMHPEN